MASFMILELFLLEMIMNVGKQLKPVVHIGQQMM
ncbi:Uncharacterised protein [Paenibacillus macerans]|uniref:Uncharacterized protein n=1 Tax=Paenibacillus macerans TaxID=44252 RepID=A0A090ZJJ2_PAEMA|nr:hypothetical protein DJ90_3787 [Paenibacillus macerans]SUA86171.1 Uncharacterised protein [Paenibacillus macerans]